MQVRSIAFFAVITLIGCGNIDENSAPPITFEEFRSTVVFEPETQTWVFNGDELIEHEHQLRDAYDSYVESHWYAQGFGVSREGLAVGRIGGNDDRWSAAAAMNLSFCISQSSFGARYQTVIAALNAASAAWEVAARVNFVHLPAQDANCTNSNNNVVFNVRIVSEGTYLARSFFPGTTRSNRELLIDTNAFGNVAPVTLTGIMRHELGHVLGFRHEHTRVAINPCFEDNNWRALTAYDTSSVMHYPQCNGTQIGDLVLTPLDRAGALALYP